MSEDRTQEPSRRRREEAKQKGQVARSPELTAAAGLVAAVGLVAAFGGDVVATLVEAVKAPWVGEAGLADPQEVVAGVRRLAAALMMPLGGILGGVVLAIAAAHQAQVGGLWAPALMTPDPARLRGGGLGAGLGARAARGAWGLAKAVLIAAMAAWAIRGHLPAFANLATLNPQALAGAAGGLLRDLVLALGLATLALGLVDYAWQRAGLETRLRTTPEEHREDQRSIEGDPAVRARRQRVAKSWRADPKEAVQGARLIVTAGDGLAVVLGGAGRGGGGNVRMVARGRAVAGVLNEANRSGVPRADAPALALALARTKGRDLPTALAAELARVWPRGA